MLSAGNLKVTPDPRIKLVEGYNLEIHDVQTQDAGDYVCQLGTLQPREITHTLEILGKTLFYFFMVMVMYQFLFSLKPKGTLLQKIFEPILFLAAL